MESDTRPAIFYAPHPDDEAIAMAGAIRRHKEEDRPVYLVLLTNGTNRSLLNILNGSRIRQLTVTADRKPKASAS